IAQLKGVRLLKTNQPAAAAAVFVDIAAKRRARFGSSAGLGVDLLQLGRAQLALGKYDDAVQSLAESEPMLAEKLSPTAPPTIAASATLAEARAEAGDAASALRTLDRIQPVVKAMPGPTYAIALHARAIALLKQGKRAEAKAVVDQAEALLKALGPAGLVYLKALPALRARIAKS
ncbi:MAG: hypothetical protein ABI240_10155, partial [Sphingomonas sp.]